MAKAIAALVRFRILCEAMHVGDIRVIATAAARDASNGPEFIARAEEAIGQPIELISGEREADSLGARRHLRLRRSRRRRRRSRRRQPGADRRRRAAASGRAPAFRSAAWRCWTAPRTRSSWPRRSSATSSTGCRSSSAMKGRDFYAVGGTWRALATLHQRQSGYPLNVMHGYTVPARDVADFARLVERADAAVLECDRRRLLGAPAAAGLWRAGPRRADQARQAARRRHLGAGRARGSAA